MRDKMSKQLTTFINKGWLFSKELPALVGVCLGALVGGVIGTMKFREFMCDYKALRRE